MSNDVASNWLNLIKIANADLVKTRIENKKGLRELKSRRPFFIL
jgi:hypothetical protein